MVNQIYSGPRHLRFCAKCGKLFLDFDLRHRYCSETCSQAAKREAKNRSSRERRQKRKESPRRSYTYTCEGCGEEYHPKAKDRASFCSRECYNAWRKPPPKVPKPKVSKTCAVCGQVFTAISKVHICCSKSCRQKRTNDLTRASSVASDKHRQAPRHFTCAECGQSVTTTYSDKRKRFCSPRCARRFWNREGKKRKRLADRRRHAHA